MAKAQSDASLPKDDLERAWRLMLLIRRFEEKAGQLYGMGLIGGFCHLYIGQEAVRGWRADGACRTVMKLSPPIATTATCWATGMAPARRDGRTRTGRAAGYSHGKGGSMHMFSRGEKNFFGGHGIVGAQVSLGTGLAFSNMYRGNDRVAVAYLGEGASNQGQVFESFNLAALLKLPCIYVIENNRYGMGTSVERASASRDLSRNGSPWHIPGVQVDGMDVGAVHAAAVVAVAHCRAGNGPYLMEMMTYRYRGHSMSDPAKYRTREEVQAMREQHDPIDQARARLVRLGAGEGALKAAEAEIRGVAQDAADFAQSAPEPDEAELWTDVLVEAAGA